MPAKIRVLLVEDDPDWIEGLKSVVGRTEDIILIGCIQSKQAADLLMEYLARPRQSQQSNERNRSAEIGGNKTTI